MFQFLGYTTRQRRADIGSQCRVSAFGNLRVKACLAANRSLSQPATSFIAFWCQGIHHTPCMSITFTFWLANRKIENWKFKCFLKVLEFPVLIKLNTRCNIYKIYLQKIFNKYSIFKVHFYILKFKSYLSQLITNRHLFLTVVRY